MPEVTINVNKDTYIAESAPTASFGGGVSVQIGPVGTNWWGLMGFTAHQIPAGKAIDTAMIRLEIISAVTNGTLRMEAFSSGTFSESDSWNVFTARGITYEAASNDLTVTAKGIYVLDCKDVFEASYNIGGFPMFRFVKQTGNLVAKIDSREGTGTDVSITINYTSTSGIQVQVPNIPGMDWIPSINR